MTYSESLGFTYNDIHSSEFGIMNVQTSSGLFEEQFLPNRSVIEEKIAGRDEPYFFGFEYETTEIPLTFYLSEGWDENRLYEIANWLTQSHYKPLRFDEDETRLFYCMYVGDTRILHNGLKQGYVNITMKCNSPFSFTPVYTREFNLTDNSMGVNFELYNLGHKECFPKFVIEKIGAGDISIINHTNGIESKLTTLEDKEIVTVDNNAKDIETSIPFVYRYSNFNNKFMKLNVGVNKFTVVGNSKLTITYQSKRYI